jgi:hypothetical protein
MQEEHDKMQEGHDKMQEEHDKMQEGHDKMQEEHDKMQEEHDKMQEENDGMQEKLVSYQKTHEAQLRIRANVLESAIQKPDTKKRKKRNEIAHGADLVLDLETIHLYQKSHHPDLPAVCHGFQHIYGLSVTKYREQLKHAPIEIIETLNRRGHVRLLYIWEKRRLQRSKEKIEKLCGTIINTWLESQEQSSPFPSNPVREQLQSLDYEWQKANQ